MGAKKEIIDETVTKMFINKEGEWENDEELALHIIHRFNICRDTIETMPAFENHIGSLFNCAKKEK